MGCFWYVVNVKILPFVILRGFSVSVLWMLMETRIVDRDKNRWFLGVVNEYSNDLRTVIGGKWEQAVIVDGMKRNVS